MRVSDLIQLGKQYLGLGVAAAAAVILAWLIGYFIVYRKLMKGQKKPNIRAVVWWAVMICNLAVIAGATLMSRSAIWSAGKIVPLFYSYREAWVNFTGTAWRNIILNICMFVPLGFLLPLGSKKCRTFWRTYLIGFMLTFLIELVQLILHLGIFELDDLMGNTVGTMIGYGLYALWEMLRCAISKQKKQDGKHIVLKTACLQLPLIVTVAAFSVIFISYRCQELGNHPDQYVAKYDAKHIQVTADIVFDDSAAVYPVYQLHTFSKDDAVAFARDFFQNLGEGIDESRNDFYDDTAVFWSTGDSGNRYNLWFHYQGGTYSMTDFQLKFSDAETAQTPIPQQTANAKEQAVRDTLRRYGIELLPQAVFSNDNALTYEFKLCMEESDGHVYDGTLSCDYYDSGEVSEINNNINECTMYKEFDAITEQEAYEKLCSGECNFYERNFYEERDLKIHITGCSLQYTIDSKGFYQPTYLFECEINGESTHLGIPALK